MGLADGGKGEAAKWRLEDPAELLKELRRKEEEKFASELRTAERQLGTKRQEAEKIRAAVAGCAVAAANARERAARGVGHARWRSVTP